MIHASITSLDPADWIVVDDGVMGGRSRGQMEQVRGETRDSAALRFHGVLRTQGGGFTSIRSRGMSQRLDGGGTIVLRVKGDGRRYVCDLRDSPRLRGFSATWKLGFRTEEDRWTDVRLPVADFEPFWRGSQLDRRRVEGSAPFWQLVRSIGFTVADGIDGPFSLVIGRIGTG
ncbi:MAG: CIA30 family protein [Gemmatimonadetes bacterium]|nr:CIA30 family protein [Gemmatimonadota bacterium]NNK64994.1 CIA30 family protein [Gemmatimonadota bacterium]